MIYTIFIWILLLILMLYMIIDPNTVDSELEEMEIDIASESLIYLVAYFLSKKSEIINFRKTILNNNEITLTQTVFGIVSIIVTIFYIFSFRKNQRYRTQHTQAMQSIYTPDQTSKL